MRPNFTHICRIIVFLFFLFFVDYNLFGQNKEILEFKYKVETEKTGNETLYSVVVNVTKGSGPFKYELCDKSLALGGNSLIVSEITSTKTYVFNNLKNKEYYIYVYLTAQEFGKGKMIQIK